MKFQGKSVRKYTGGRLIRQRGKKKYELGGEQANTHLGETIRKTVKTLGGSEKSTPLKSTNRNSNRPINKDIKGRKNRDCYRKSGKYTLCKAKHCDKRLHNQD